jgi:hypothetical protein
LSKKAQIGLNFFVFSSSFQILPIGAESLNESAPHAETGAEYFRAEIVPDLIQSFKG